jgi:hypothetical protein
VLDQKMTLVSSTVTAPGGIDGTGNVVVVDNGADNNLAKFRFQFASVPMQAAEEDFQAGGRQFRAGAFIIANADRAKIEPALKELGLSGYAMASAPTVKSHDLDVPRIGYVHSWARTQDEGWVRAAFDTYGLPYTYMADQKLRDGNLRAKYDVIIFPHVGGTAASQVAGIAMTGKLPLPYKKTAETPSLGTPDESDDIRGGMGIEGLMNLYKFVQEGGTLIVEGSTSTIFPEYNLTSGVAVETPAGLFARGTLLRGLIADKRSPLVYGYSGNQLPIYFNSGPVLNAGGTDLAGGFGGGRGAPGISQNIAPMAQPLTLSSYDSTTATLLQLDQRPGLPNAAAAGRGGRGAGADSAGRRGAGGGGGGGGGGFGGANATPAAERPRVVLQFPSDPNQMLLSGTLVGGQALADRAQLVDAKLGKGHVVMFAIRPFWRWQTQGTYMLGFNAIMNWNDLDAGRAGPAPSVSDQGAR